MHWFLDPIKNHYADFSGRATRQQFWMFILVWFLISIAFGIVATMVNAAQFLHFIVLLAILIPSIAITTRRLHDTNMSGWWQVLSLIPVLGIIIMIILLVRSGSTGANQYGSDPYGSAGDSTDIGAPMPPADAPVAPPAAPMGSIPDDSTPPQQQ